MAEETKDAVKFVADQFEGMAESTSNVVRRFTILAEALRTSREHPSAELAEAVIAHGPQLVEAARRVLPHIEDLHTVVTLLIRRVREIPPPAPLPPFVPGDSTVN